MRVEFLTKLRVELEDSGFWRLLAPFAVRLDGVPFVVPEGFETDFDSVPRLPVAYMFLGNSGIRAAVLHDFLYDSRSRMPDGARVSRDYADRAFRDAMCVEGLPSFVARFKYAGVRLAGGGPYQEYGSP